MYIIAEEDGRHVVYDKYSEKQKPLRIGSYGTKKKAQEEVIKCEAADRLSGKIVTFIANMLKEFSGVLPEDEIRAMIREG